MPKSEDLEDLKKNNKKELEDLDSISKDEIKNEIAEGKLKDSNESKNETSKEEEQEITVIDKIKNFLSKVIAMQEEVKREREAEENEKQEIEKLNSEVSNISTKSKYLPEYYDLPYRYNETVIKILAQTPKKLFVYWDIADSDRQKYVESFGDDFFYKTYPVLLLYNEDRKYIKEIPINDFANSWYIDIDDPKTKYIIQLGRKFIGKPEVANREVFNKNNIILRNDYLPFADSNEIEVPNDHVLLEFLPRMIRFRNVKTGEEYDKALKDFKDVYGNNYDVEKFYNEQYDNELSDGRFDMNNPSSGVNSSMFK